MNVIFKYLHRYRYIELYQKNFVFVKTETLSNQNHIKKIPCQTKDTCDRIIIITFNILRHFHPKAPQPATHLCAHNPAQWTDRRREIYGALTANRTDRSRSKSH